MDSTTMNSTVHTTYTTTDKAKNEAINKPINDPVNNTADKKNRRIISQPIVAFKVVSAVSQAILAAEQELDVSSDRDIL